MDTVRFDRVNAERNGQPVMPYLSRAAKEGVFFTHAMSPCSWTRAHPWQRFLPAYLPKPTA